MKVTCVGESTLDYYLDLDKGFVGGISLNFAVHSKRCGAEEVALVSCLGDDSAGRLILQKLGREGIDTSHLRVQPGDTARQDIRIVAGGERVFPANGYHPGVLADYRLSQSDLRFIQTGDVVMCPLFQQIEPVFKQVMEEMQFEGKRVVDFLDLADYGRDCRRITPFVDQLDLAFISGDQDMVDMLLPLSRGAPGVIVVTRGAGGSTALVKGARFDQPALTVENSVDSTGCGDAFQAAFSLFYFRHGDVAGALYQGARQAAGVIQHYGASDER